MAQSLYAIVAERRKAKEWIKALADDVYTTRDGTYSIRRTLNGKWEAIRIETDCICTLHFVYNDDEFYPSLDAAKDACVEDQERQRQLRDDAEARRDQRAFLALWN